MEKVHQTDYALLFSFKMKTSNGVTKLFYQSTDTLRLEDQRWRFTDMVYHKGSLYLMSSIVGSYGIERIKMNNGKLDMASRATVIDKSILSSRINSIDSTHNSNMEGMVLDDQGSIYLVSDNVWGPYACNDTKLPKKTLLLKLTKH